MVDIDPTTVRTHIENAADRLGRVWPLYSDVAANPLSGFEDRPFRQAVEDAEALFDGRGYPTADQFRRAWESGEIDATVLNDLLDEHGIDDEPGMLLRRMAHEEAERSTADVHDERLNRLCSKWLAAFLDQGQAGWPMPDRERGFYQSWRQIAPYDRRIPESETSVATYYREQLSDAPETAMEALYAVLSAYDEDEWEAIFEHHLAALPGWVGLIKQRAEANNNPWQDEYPVTLTDYLAVRLILAKHMGAEILPETDGAERPKQADFRLQEIWLTAWERSYQEDLLEDINKGLAASNTELDADRPDAQLVFCIDTRSEIIRRHLEATGAYETHGYAGFFGVPIEYSGHESKVQTDSCPVMVDPKHHVTERPPAEDPATASYERWHRLKADGNKFLKALKNDLAAAFGFVEASGTFFGAALASRTLFPSKVHDARGRLGPDHPARFSSVTLDEPDDDDERSPAMGISTDQKVFYAEAAFDLMGWDDFAPVVVFTGHESETVNNPYKSSIDCGACSGSPGTPNARVLASICNDPEVRERLAERGIEVPDDTVFLAGRHNTTTDEVTVYTEGHDLTERQRAVVGDLREDLERAQAGAAEERLETLDVDADDGVREVETRTEDWAQPRPEIGLSGNAGFVIGPRALTADVDLDGRSFLHSYDWNNDPEGEALENIMAGPLVVCQMINAQYYFSTVDNETYGSGSKTTHNAVGNVGVLQGNGGDLQMGLPLQSLYADDRTTYHTPVRLSTVIHAPVDTVTDILDRNADLAALLDNNWLSLLVIDPTQDDTTFRYQPGMEWEPLDATLTTRITVPSTD
ncbi:DUF2309 domain-containing protein [Haloarcula laminariae]|uniref:DUF2309 domain-containing protein n=1 Tax=Haloarcula laminariae TaxID=2961577 RepID=UPI00240571DE|nr:DUF2309 domain-containing protein [Halomicroarcula sp. FL173]